MAQVLSVAQELPHATGMAKKKKGKMVVVYLSREIVYVPKQKKNIHNMKKHS